MVLIFYINEKQIFVAKNRSEVVKRINEYNEKVKNDDEKIKSFSKNQITKNLKDDNEYKFVNKKTKDEYKLTEHNKKRVINKLKVKKKENNTYIKNNIDLDDEDNKDEIKFGDNFKLNEIRITPNKKKFGYSLIDPYSTIKTEINDENKDELKGHENLDKDGNIISSRVYTEFFTRFTEDILKNYKKQRRRFRFIMSYAKRSEYDSAKIKNKPIIWNNVSTKYETYNNFYDAITELIEGLVNNYGEDYIQINEINIRMYDIPKLGKQFVLGGLTDSEKLKRELIEKYLLLNIEKMNKFLSKNIIGCVDTVKNCIVRAVLHSYYQTDEKKKIEDRLSNIYRDLNYNTLTKECDTQCELLSMYLKTQINVYNEDLEIEEIYGKNLYEKKINILVYATHSFYLLDRELCFNEVAYYKKFNEQKKMKYDTDDEKKEKKDKNNKIDIKYGSYDFETYNYEGKTKSFCVGFCIENKYNFIKKKDNEDCITENFIKYLQTLYFKKRTKLIMYAHNGGKFDAYEIIYKCLNNNIDVHSFLCKNGRIIKFCIGHKNLIIEFRDSYTILQDNLDNLLKDFKCKIKKMTGTVDYNIVNEENSHKDIIFEHFKNYLKNDVLGLYELMMKIKKIFKEKYEIELCDILTNASLSRKFFINNHNWKGNPLCEIPYKKYIELKKHYLGGRNEVFKLGQYKGKFYYYDYTSLYPYVMGKSLYPHGKYTTKHPKNKSKFNRNWFGMVKCNIKTINFDMIPLHGVKENGKLLFSHFKDFKELWIPTEEIRFSIDNNLGYEYEFLEVLDYDDKDYLFKKIVDDLYKTKIEAEKDDNPALRGISKIIINSLYGFFGIKIDDVEQITIKKFTDYEKKTTFISKQMQRDIMVDYYDKGDKTIIHTKERLDCKCANIIIAIFTTSYARIELYKLMTDIKKKGGEIYYCDTDSIITNLCFEDNEELHKKYRTCIKGDDIKLGDLTNETKIRNGYYDEIITLGCKSYFLHFPNEDLNNNRLPDTKIKSELKFKGFNIKERYNNYEVDEENKKILLTGINRNEGLYSVTPKDYILMSKGYTLETDNYAFITGKSSLRDNSNIKYIENSKKSIMNYTKGNNNKGIITPLSLNN